MLFSIHWSWLAALSCLFTMGEEVWCDCTEAGMEIEGGDYVLTRQLKRDSRLIYQCPEGYYPYPALTRLCQPNGSWKPVPKRFLRQRCQRVECPDPTVLEYGNVSPPQERYFADNETTYECYSGHKLRGSSRRVCLPNGKWSGSTPICSNDGGDNCADPGIPPGASRIGNIFEFDYTVKYTCNSNLFLVGPSERKCQENGQWTGQEPACYYRHTYDTPLEVSQAFGSSIRESLTMLEPAGDTQEGRKIRISRNGTLNIYIAMDISESIENNQVAQAKEAVTRLISKIASFSVTPNYDIAFFSSEILEVVSIMNFFNGKIKLADVKKRIEAFDVSRQNTAGTNLCLVFKKILEKMGAIKERVKEEAFKEHRHAIIVFTDGAYNMGGSPTPTVRRIKNMVYMNHTSETQSQTREDYLDIYIFAIGAEIFEDDLRALTVGAKGKHYFKLQIKDLSQTFDEMIDEEDVKGLCGLHKEYEASGKNSERKRFPWMTFVFIQNQGQSVTCSGSLVSPQFVLTAAHCLPFGVTEKNVKVEIDDGQGRVKSVKTFIVHPKFNVSLKAHAGVKEFYDYDVALIQLMEDVHISNIARPICIPGTQETSDALQLIGDSTCQQQEQLLFKDNLERLAFLTKKGNQVSEKDIHAKLGSNRDECISHALEAEGITTKKPKDAVTDNFLCTGGRSPYRDHIACTGDSGGAVFKNYEHRTVQVAVVSWGTKILCKSGGVVESDDSSRDFHINLFRVTGFLKSILGRDDQDDYAPLTFLKC
ncbi:complement factor B-like [Brachionichthys hirsutus]|uniref:complement factor B-like n=1 Tax=Brachionichthys hirsutus TaxID=412623 RepID=UPI0036047BD4